MSDSQHNGLRSSALTRITRAMDRRWRMLLQVRQQDGTLAAAWEIAYQTLRPLLTAYTRIRWRWYRRKQGHCFPVRDYQLVLLPQDRGVSIELAVHRTHEPRTSLLLSNCVGPGMTVLDVGSNLGYYAVLESRLVGSRGKVIAVEPVPQNAELCERNINLNRCSNIVFRQLAISDENAMLPLHLSDRSNWHSLNPVPLRTRNVWVPACTLDTLVEGFSLARLDLVRMDLEGYELKVLNGMHSTIRRYSPRLLVEIHPQIVGPAAMRQYLRELQVLGYSPDWVLDQERDVPVRWRFLSPERMSMDELIEDWRINTYPRSLMVMFARSLAAQTANSLSFINSYSRAAESVCKQLA